MNLDLIRESIETKVYHIPRGRKVPLHSHEDQDEVFYCIKGSGFGISEDGEVELGAGDTFVVPAGRMHSLRSEGDLYVAAFLIPADKIVCRCNQVSFGEIRRAMAEGARTIEEIQEATGAGTGCGGCIEEIEGILQTACGCKGVSMGEVADAVRNGADTADKIEAATGAGTGCGRCRALLDKAAEIRR